MKSLRRLSLVFSFFYAIPSVGQAATDRFHISSDFVFPYVLMVSGSSFTERGNTAVGVEGAYHWTESFHSTLRSEFDVDSKNGLNKQVALAPGLQYRWLTEERFNPFFRFDLPVYLKSSQDIGAAVGLGLIWNLGGAIGLPGMALRYDFNVEYDVGLGDAVSVLSLDMLKIGVEYRF